MKNKKLSHNGLQGSVTSVMAALLCIQPSHPLSFPSAPAPNLSQHQSLFQ